MIKINQIKMPVGSDRDHLIHKIYKLAGCTKEDVKNLTILKKSIDARKSNQIMETYSVSVCLPSAIEKRLMKNYKDCDNYKEVGYCDKTSGIKPLKHRPVIIGSGPCGLFAAYFLAKNGYCPLILERGKSVLERQKDVDLFWNTGILDLESNVQFGEGGAGTFSDGKLNTLVKDSDGRNREVLRIFVAAGAPEDILYEAKPHIGTDVLVQVLQNLRHQIEEWGGTYQFQSKVTGFLFDQNQVKGVRLSDESIIETENVILAIGHSARDTFEMLSEHHFNLEAKSFAVGLRVEHPQSMIQKSQYGDQSSGLLPASYKLTGKGRNQRGVYSFCMCPGGYVVNASSENQRLAINGMSERARDSKNANSAIIVAVTPEDFPNQGPLAGMEFQRSIEEKAFQLGNGAIVQQLYKDYKNKQKSVCAGSFKSETKGDCVWGDLSSIYPDEIRDAFIDGMEDFNRKIKGFAGDDVILSGVETRTSSPVRIVRDETMQSNWQGIYPGGEGAGYAGGIMSAAMDGIRLFEEIAKNYQRME